MELLAKIFITLLVVLTAAKVMHWTWTSHIDPIASFYKFVGKEPKIADVVVTRDPNKLYQGGIAVADITGTVKINNGTIILKQITNASALDRGKPIEYRRLRLKVIRVGNMIGMKTIMSDKGSNVLQNVMEDVVCEEIK
jgi:hypothetical protein